MSQHPRQPNRQIVMEVRRKQTIHQTLERSPAAPAQAPVALTPHAQDQLRAAHLTASAENRAAADLWLRSVRDEILGLAVGDHPVAPESRLFGLAFYELVLSELALRILFRIEKGAIQVLDIQRHGNHSSREKTSPPRR